MREWDEATAKARDLARMSAMGEELSRADQEDVVFLVGKEAGVGEMFHDLGRLPGPMDRSRTRLKPPERTPVG